MIRQMVDVIRTRALDLSDEIGKRDFRRHRRGDMHMLFDAPNRVHDRAQRLRLADDVTVQLGFDCRRDERRAFFRRQGNVIEQAPERHRSSSRQSPLDCSPGRFSVLQPFSQIVHDSACIASSKMIWESRSCLTVSRRIPSSENHRQRRTLRQPCFRAARQNWCNP